MIHIWASPHVLSRQDTIPLLISLRSMWGDREQAWKSISPSNNIILVNLANKYCGENKIVLWYVVWGMGEEGVLDVSGEVILNRGWNGEDRR